MADAPVLGAGTSVCGFKSHLPHHQARAWSQVALRVFFLSPRLRSGFKQMEILRTRGGKGQLSHLLCASEKACPGAIAGAGFFCKLTVGETVAAVLVLLFGQSLGSGEVKDQTSGCLELLKKWQSAKGRPAFDPLLSFPWRRMVIKE